VIGYPRSDVAAIISSARTSILIAGGLIAVLICGLIALLVLRSIVRPVGVLVHAADALARGDVSISIPDKGLDEIGSLSRSSLRSLTHRANVPKPHVASPTATSRSL
jgi:HAMP domain-containing protein